ncbi:MAG: carboxypeptidase-like regulatory domain-containing protein [Planctomycetaceae bacterium]|jgi:hypothetical protein|nr:carboxypeptidase-like regulatory domain-containing protein [Planctomycetaceae bacterium]
MKITKCIFIVVCLFVLLSGCDKNAISVVPVSGTVVYQGQGVEKAVVVFIPADDSTSDRSASATTNSQGEFVLETLTATKSGAMIGNYVVVIDKSVPIDTSGKILTDEELINLQSPPKMKNILPKKYADRSTTPLKVEITKNKNIFQFELTD